MDSFFQRVSSIVLRTFEDDEMSFLPDFATRRRSAPDIQRNYPRSIRRTTLKGISDEQIATRSSRLNSLGKSTLKRCCFSFPSSTFIAHRFFLMNE